jgi:AraR C-terminal winged HTH domain
VRRCLGYAPICFELLPKLFTRNELQALTEAILGQTLDRRNFRRKVPDTSWTPAQRTAGASRQHPFGITFPYSHLPDGTVKARLVTVLTSLLFTCFNMLGVSRSSRNVIPRSVGRCGRPRDQVHSHHLGRFRTIQLSQQFGRERNNTQVPRSILIPVLLFVSHICGMAPLEVVW